MMLPAAPAGKPGPSRAARPPPGAAGPLPLRPATRARPSPPAARGAPGRGRRPGPARRGAREGAARPAGERVDSAAPMTRTITNVVGFDDSPFAHAHRGDVRLVGAVCSRTRLDGVLAGRVRRDGVNSTERMVEMLRRSQFNQHVRAVLLQGIAVAGFNVVDIHALRAALGVPVLVVVRRPPRLGLVERALFDRTPGAARKWRLIQQAGPIERVGEIWVQRAGLSLEAAGALVAATTLHGNIPEPLRLAHLIAGGVETGVSRGRT